jgi:hypothetical protein
MVVMALLGCGQSGGKKSSSSSAGTTTPATTTGTNSNVPAGSLQVTAFTPDSGPAASTGSLNITFSKAVDEATFVEGTTWVAAEDDDTNPGGNFHVKKGGIDVDASGLNATFTPVGGFQAGHEIRLVLTSGVLAVGGGALEQGSVGGSLSFTSVFADQAFEGRFQPTNGGVNAAPSPGLANGVTPGPTMPPSTPAPGPTTAGAFEVVRTTPTANATDPVPTTIYIEFSNPVDKSTLTGGSGGTLAVLQATATSTTMSFPKFGIRWENGDTRLAIVPQPLFTPGKDMFVLLGSGLKDVTGKSLAKGAASSTITKKTWLTNLIFELKFTPTNVPTPALGGDPSIYQLEAGTDPWFIDFDLRASQFQSDMQKHGLLSSDAIVNGLAKSRIMASLLGNLSMKYGRTPDGKGQPGAWKISFTAQRPAGTPGKDFSREAVGGLPPSQGTLGISNMDTGNRFKDDNAKAGSGIFSAVIFGVDSKLDPFLNANDKKFLDGSYTLGSGSATDDARMVRIHTVIDDWSRALSSVTAHECGHSVGLSHVDSALSIMDSASTSSQLSEPRLFFVQSSAQILDANLGKQ